MALASSPAIKFSVRRRDAELVAPARPTPREFKLLSDIDDQRALRFQVPFIQVFRRSDKVGDSDPAAVIKDAIAEALVPYYPFAGRIREGAEGKLAVECTGEGVVFIEAEADVRVEDLEDADALRPPFPCLEEILYDVPGTEGIINSPLLLIQVTRLMCGGFFFGIRFNHTMCDGQGIVQFMFAVGEVARGVSLSPFHLPPWDRHIFSSRNPPCIAFRHPEYCQEEEEKDDAHDHQLSLVHHCFFFTPPHIAALRSLLLPQLQSSFSTFDLLTACLWRCRTRALRPLLLPHHQMRMICVVSARHSKFQPLVPPGFYGNSFALPVAIAPAGELCRNPLGYAAAEVTRAKKEVTAEYMQSVADLMATRGRPDIVVVGMRTCLVSDLRHIKFGEVDFGWGKAVYSGPADVGIISGISSFYFAFRRRNKKKGDEEEGILADFCLPRLAMGRFVAEVERMTNSSNQQQQPGQAQAEEEEEEEWTPDTNSNSLNLKL